jgi:hypothetical protein
MYEINLKKLKLLVMNWLPFQKKDTP